MKASKIISLADCEDYIAKNFGCEGVGLNLSAFSKTIFEKHLKVNLVEGPFLEYKKLREEIKYAVTFLQETCLKQGIDPFWYKVNIHDQAVNDYVGIGRLNLKSDWLKFIVDYLDYDRAEQSGDSLIAIFDNDFHWTICFVLSQDYQQLTVQLLDK